MQTLHARPYPELEADTTRRMLATSELVAGAATEQQRQFEENSRRASPVIVC